jgi:hypothetical protein
LVGLLRERLDCALAQRSDIQRTTGASAAAGTQADASGYLNPADPEERSDSGTYVFNYKALEIYLKVK